MCSMHCTVFSIISNIDTICGVDSDASVFTVTGGDCHCDCGAIENFYFATYRVVFLSFPIISEVIS